MKVSNSTDEFANPSRAAVSYYDREGARNLDLSKDGVDCFELFSRTSVRKAKGKETEIHIHPGSYEVLYCQRGAGLIFKTASEFVPLRAGEFFVVPPDCPHCLETSPKKLVTYGFQLYASRNEASFLGLSQKETGWLMQRFADLKAYVFKGTDAQQALFRRMFSLYDGERRGTLRRRILMRACALNLILETLDAAERVGQSGDGRGSQRLKTLVEDIRAHPEKQRSLDEMSEYVYLSPAKLIAVFRAETGLPPHAFMLSCRIERAREHLAKTSLSVAEISSRLGFSAPRHFSTHFKAIVGMTPLAWRKAMRSKSP